MKQYLEAKRGKKQWFWRQIDPARSFHGSQRTIVDAAAISMIAAAPRNSFR
ncbi:hypothetical protein [Pseudomonas cichorii]|uniref:hypothetical protein n=1 Tax=Pseudomonas cichorii TaxID=36746 RepID=UPI001C8AD99F|nr:hypothetical protein [Pseudomonas cichorii]MBX8497841.1 hypothetical protein [Pseudomonas cichorii]